MQTHTDISPFRLSFITTILLISGCSRALIYEEGTNLSLATFKVNDDVSEPVSANFGLKRTVAAITPPQEGKQDSVNMISSISFNDESDFFGTGMLTINTRFASGNASLLLSEKPSAAAKLINADSLTPDTPELMMRKNQVTNYIRKVEDSQKLAVVAEKMEVKGNRKEDKDSILNALIFANADQLTKYTTIINQEFGVNLK